MISFMFCEGHSVVLKIDTREKGDGREVETLGRRVTAVLGVEEVRRGPI